VEVLQSAALRPLWAGALYLLLLVVVGQVAWRVRRWLERRATPTALRVRSWGGWAFWRRVADLVLTLTYLFVGLFDGTFAAGDVGLIPLEISGEWWWLLGLELALVGWMALLWGLYWRRCPRWRKGDGAWEEPTWGQMALQVPSHEGRMAIVRAALIPLLGAYWGAWAAVVCLWLVSILNPLRRARLRTPSGRAFLYLGWATDWLSALFFVLTGSLWVALLSRTIAYLFLRALSGWLHRHRATAGPRPGR
jgi:hypothetical protein